MWIEWTGGLTKVVSAESEKSLIFEMSRVSSRLISFPDFCVLQAESGNEVLQVGCPTHSWKVLKVTNSSPSSALDSYRMEGVMSHKTLQVLFLHPNLLGMQVCTGTKCGRIFFLLPKCGSNSPILLVVISLFKYYRVTHYIGFLPNVTH